MDISNHVLYGVLINSFLTPAMDRPLNVGGVVPARSRRRPLRKQALERHCQAKTCSYLLNLFLCQAAIEVQPFLTP
jgi:hypothetical protein